MATQNGTTSSQTAQHLLDERMQALRASMHKLVDRFSTTASGEPSKAKQLVTKAGETIKAHPIAAVAVAGALGYIAVRIARR